MPKSSKPSAKKSAKNDEPAGCKTCPSYSHTVGKGTWREIFCLSAKGEAKTNIAPEAQTPGRLVSILEAQYCQGPETMENAQAQIDDEEQ